MFTIPALQILLLEGRLVVSPDGAQRVTGSERVKFTVKNQKTFRFCWNCLKSDCLKTLAVFEWLLIISFF